MTFITLLINLFATPIHPDAQVEVTESEIEGIFVPAGYTGPIVAAPFTESAF
jgi:hypothetical protein